MEQVMSSGMRTSDIEQFELAAGLELRLELVTVS
jgi:hypothetical protein